MRRRQRLYFDDEASALQLSGSRANSGGYFGRTAACIFKPERAGNRTAKAACTRPNRANNRNMGSGAAIIPILPRRAVFGAARHRYAATARQPALRPRPCLLDDRQRRKTAAHRHISRPNRRIGNRTRLDGLAADLFAGGHQGADNTPPNGQSTGLQENALPLSAIHIRRSRAAFPDRAGAAAGVMRRHRNRPCRTGTHRLPRLGGLQRKRNPPLRTARAFPRLDICRPRHTAPRRL